MNHICSLSYTRSQFFLAPLGAPQPWWDVKVLSFCQACMTSTPRTGLMGVHGINKLSTCRPSVTYVF